MRRVAQISGYDGSVMPEEILLVRIFGKINRFASALPLDEQEDHRKKVSETVAAVLKTIPYREREVLKLRSLPERSDGYIYTLVEVAKIFKCKLSRVRSAQTRAIKSLRTASRASRLTEIAGLPAIEAPPHPLYQDPNESGVRVVQDTRILLPANIPNSEVEAVFNLSVRSKKCLMRHNVKRLEDLINVTGEELLGSRNFGFKSLRMIVESLNTLGLSLKQPK